MDHLKDPLYKNSFYLILSSIASAGFGFFFWIVAAKIYSPEDVGIATALIASIGILILISRLGFEESIIRFFPVMNKDRVFMTSLLVTTVFSLVVGIIFIIGIPIWSPKLSIIYSIIPLFLITLLINSIYSVSSITLIAIRRANLYFIQNLMNGSRILFLFPLAFLGSVGILGSTTLAVAITLILPVTLFYKYNLRLHGIDKEFLSKSYNFSFWTYFSGLLLILPMQIQTILILNIEGPTVAAVYFITYTIVSLLLVIPSAFSTSLFVEGSHGASLKRSTMKTLVSIFILLIPAILFLCFFGDILLGFVGEEYKIGFELMKIMAISTIFYSIFQVYLSIKKAQKDMGRLFVISALNFILILGLSYVFLNFYGMVGIGYAWFIGYMIIMLVIGIMAKMENWF